MNAEIPKSVIESAQARHERLRECLELVAQADGEPLAKAVMPLLAHLLLRDNDMMLRYLNPLF